MTAAAAVSFVLSGLGVALLVAAIVVGRRADRRTDLALNDLAMALGVGAGVAGVLGVLAGLVGIAGAVS